MSGVPVDGGYEAAVGRPPRREHALRSGKRINPTASHVENPNLAFRVPSSQLAGREGDLAAIGRPIWIGLRPVVLGEKP